MKIPRLTDAQFKKFYTAALSHIEAGNLLLARNVAVAVLSLQMVHTRRTKKSEARRQKMESILTMTKGC